MSRQCPLCGKNKPEEALFCEDCAMKIRADYEIDLPEFQKEENIPVEEEGGPGNVNFPIASEAKVPEMPNVADTEEATDTFDASTKKPQKKPLLWIALAAVLLAGAFFVYNETIRKGNLERSGWEKALKMNSVEGYVAYMASHPGGARFEEAQEPEGERGSALGAVENDGQHYGVAGLPATVPEKPVCFVGEDPDRLALLGGCVEYKYC